MRWAATLPARAVAVALTAGPLAARAASVSKSIDVKAPPSEVWARVGPFCSIKEWHPDFGQCTQTGGVRTLTTKDGRGPFVEKQVASEAKATSYSYTIEKSPLPLTSGKATFKVVPKGENVSTVEWSSTYTPNKGQEQAANDAIAALFQAGLDSIQRTGGR